MNTHIFYKTIHQAKNWLMLICCVTTLQLSGQTDISIYWNNDSQITAIGDTVAFTLVAKNKGFTPISNLIVELYCPSTLDYIDVDVPLNTTYNNNNKLWDINNQLNSNGDSLELTIRFSSNEVGVHFLSSEVIAMDEMDTNSIPNNQNFLENDYAVTCATVPIPIYTSMSDSIFLTAPLPLSGGHQWLEEGNNGLQVVSSDAIYAATQPGVYFYKNEIANCDAITCCGVIIEEGILCPIIDLPPSVAICAGGSTQLTPILDIPTTGTFSWSPSSGLSNANTQNPIATPNTTTTYTVTFSDGGDCEVSADITIIVGQNNALNVTSNSVVCPNSPFQLMVSGGTSYTWSPSLGLSATDIPNPIATISTTTTYTVTSFDGICTSTGMVTLTVDSEAPLFNSIPQNITINCGEALPSVPTVTATDNLDDAPTINYSVDTPNATDCPYLITRTWVAIDNCNNQNLITQVIMVNDNEAPTFSNVPLSLTLDCSDIIPIVNHPLAIDNCDDDLMIDFEEIEQGDDCNMQITRRWTATDNCGNITTTLQTILVQDNAGPILSGIPADISTTCGDIPLPVDPIVTDNCDVDIEVNFNEQQSGQGCFYTLIRTWAATDNCGNTTIESQNIYVQDMEAPLFSNVPADLTISCDNDIPDPEILTATDNCDDNIVVQYEEITTLGNCGYSLIRTWTAIDNCSNTAVVEQVIFVSDVGQPIFSTIPNDLIINCIENIPITPIITAINECNGQSIDVVFAETINGNGCNTSILRTWSAMDDCGNIASISQVIALNDNEAPNIFNIPLDLTVECSDGIPPPITPVFSDNCDENPMLNFEESHQNTGCNEEIIRIWTVTDFCGNSSEATQVIKIEDNIAPVFTSAFPDLNINCDATSANIPTPIATDNCNSDIEINFVEVILSGDCQMGMEKIRTWMATDACGNSTTATQFINIQDNSVPILAGIPADLTVSCNNLPAPVNPTVTDNCDTDVTLIFEEQQTGSGCNYASTRTWTAIDDCGNSVSEQQLLTINDTQAPNIELIHPLLQGINSGDTLVMQCGATNIFGDDDAIATDDCDNNPSIELLEGDILVSTCAEDDFLVWMECYWEATDACGNVSQFLIYIKVVDTTPPNFITPPLNLFLNCGDPIPNPVTPAISDNCSPVSAIQIIAEEEIISGNCPENETIIRTWIAIDECGNTEIVTQTIVIEDMIAPQILGVPADITIDETLGEIIPPAPMLTAIDDCVGQLPVLFEEAEIQGNCQRTLTRTWSAMDNCGNVTSNNQVIVVLEDCGDCMLPVVENMGVTPTICNQATGTAWIDLVGNDNDYTFTWVPNMGISTSAINNERENLPAGDYLIIINYLGQADCEDKVELTIEDDCPGAPLFQNEMVAIGYDCEKEIPEYCLDIPYSEIGDYTCKMNGMLFEDFEAGCDLQLKYSYNISTLPNMGNGGGFILENWTVNGTIYTFEFEHNYELVDFMNTVSPEGEWHLNDNQSAIYGNPIESDLGSMKIIHTTTGITSILVLNSNSTPQGTIIKLPPNGFHEIILTRNIDQNKDTLTLISRCITTDTIYNTIELNQLDSVCLSKEELLGSSFHTEKSCLSGSGSVAEFNIFDVANGCFTCQGKTVGTEKSCISICDEYGLCDTTVFIVEVRAPKEWLPMAKEDRFSLLKYQQKLVDVLGNDLQIGEQPQVRILNTILPESIEITTQKQETKIVLNTDYCNDQNPENDYFIYEVCNDYGCDTAKVFLNINCNGVVVYTGFSPNGDGINDYFKIEGLESYTEYQLTIFNRWGNRVFKSNHYQNDWDGRAGNNFLPDDTYFYLLELEGDSSISGYIQISR